MRRGEWGDPAGVIERRQEAGCHGCQHQSTIFGLPACDKGQRPGRKCKQYTGRKAMTLEDRLLNWGRVVRSPRFKAGTCALWAQWYVAIRDHGTREPAAHITRDERDAWDVERAWQAIPNPVTKTLLKAWYVDELNEGMLRRVMWDRHGARIRKESRDFALENARRDIGRELIRLIPVVSEKKFTTNTCKREELFV